MPSFFSLPTSFCLFLSISHLSVLLSLHSTVKDPVTGGDVIIRDNADAGKIDPDKLDSSTPGGYSTNVPNSDNYDQKHVAPHPSEPSSILLQQFPPPIQTEAMGKLNAHFDQLAIALAAAMALVWFFTAFGSGWFRFLIRSTVTGGVAFCGWSALHLSKRKIQQDFEAGEFLPFPRQVSEV